MESDPDGFSDGDGASVDKLDRTGQDGSTDTATQAKGPDGNSATPNRSGKKMRGRGRKNRLQWKLTRLTTVIS